MPRTRCARAAVLSIQLILLVGCGTDSADRGDPAMAPAPPPATYLAYVANYTSSTIAGYRINSSGNTFQALGKVSTGAGHVSPAALAVAGRHLFVAYRNSHIIEAMAIDSSTGALTPTGASVPLDCPS